MTIIYIHGVSVRDRAHGERLERSFQRWLGPKLAQDGGSPQYLPVFWGDVAATFRWQLASRPKTLLLRQGGDEMFAGLGSLREAGPRSVLDQQVAAPAAAPSGPVLGRPGAATTQPTAPPLSSLPAARRADFIADLYLAVRPREKNADDLVPLDPIAEEPYVSALADAAADVAQRWNEVMQSASTDDGRAAKLVQAVENELQGSELLAQGGFRDWMGRAGETLKRAAFWPADAVSSVFAELRPVAHEFIARFIGDVLVYLNEREVEGGPGEIPNRVLAALRSACEHRQATGEPIVVITHSMGGQLFYDAVTYFAAADASLRDLVVDHWISCGSQVSLFAELGAFKGQNDTRAPGKLARPARVAAWTNFYDHNDLVGFIMQPVFDGVEDHEYNTGYGLAFAHSGFLARPSFFEAMAARI